MGYTENRPGNEEQGTDKSFVARATESAKELKDTAKKVAQEASAGADTRSEGGTTKAIEHYTSRVPSGGFLALALGSIAVSGLLRLVGRKEDANFVGQWAPTILIMGLYNKLVKLHGSEG
jgi:hypothetical protein